MRYLESSADVDGYFRYRLRRAWRLDLPSVVWVMLNPSTADAFKPDPTVTKCAQFADRWGCGAIEIVNLYAYRTSSPAVLKAAGAPVGDRNDQAIRQALTGAHVVVAAWGNHGHGTSQAAAVMTLFGELGHEVQCLGRTDSGAPIHPSARGKHFIPLDRPLKPFR